MTIYLHASTPKSQWRTGSTEDSFKTLTWQLESEYGHADPALMANRLDLVLCGAAFRDLTGWKALPFGVRLERRDLIDLWQGMKGLEYVAGSPYPDWVWASTWGFLGVLGREGRSARLAV